MAAGERGRGGGHHRAGIPVRGVRHLVCLPDVRGAAAVPDVPAPGVRVVGVLHDGDGRYVTADGSAAEGKDGGHRLVGPVRGPAGGLASAVRRVEGLAAVVAAVRRRGASDLRVLRLVPLPVPGEDAAVVITSVETIPVRVPVRPELAITSRPRRVAHRVAVPAGEAAYRRGAGRSRRGVVYAAMVRRGSGHGGTFYQHVLRPGADRPRPDQDRRGEPGRVPVGRRQPVHQVGSRNGPVGLGRKGGGPAGLRTARRQGARVRSDEVVGVRPAAGGRRGHRPLGARPGFHGDEGESRPRR